METGIKLTFEDLGCGTVDLLMASATRCDARNLFLPSLRSVQDRSHVSARRPKAWLLFPYTYHTHEDRIFAESDI